MPFVTGWRPGGYSDSALRLYGAAARLALGALDKAYWLIDPKDDLDTVRQHPQGTRFDTYPNDPTRSAYFKGLAKLEEYLRFRCHRPAPEKQTNWAYFLDPLPEVLAGDVRAYVAIAAAPGCPRRSIAPPVPFSATSPSPCAGWWPNTG